jgi:maltooligosyltrehalose trehalohydrolase
VVLIKEEFGGYYSDFGSLSHLAKALERTFVYDGMYSHYRNRMHGRAVGNLSQHRFLGFIQNHDQVGNSAVGARIGQTVGADRAKIAAALVLLGPFVPMLFQGEEWNAGTPFQYFADHKDKELARQVSEGRKREFMAFGWDPATIPDPENRDTLLRSKLNWDELAEPAHADMLTWYRKLIELRLSMPCLNNGEPGNTAVAYDEEHRWIRMTRGAIVVACNLHEEPQSVPVDPSAKLLFGSREDMAIEGDRLSLPPDSVAVLRIEVID